MSLLLRCEYIQVRDKATIEPLAISITWGIVLDSPRLADCLTITKLLGHYCCGEGSTLVRVDA